MGIQLFACHPWLDDTGQVVRINRQNFVHLHYIYANPTCRRVNVPLKRGSSAKWNYRDFVSGTYLNNLGYLIFVLGKNHSIRPLVFQPCCRVTMLFTYCITCLKPISKLLLKDASDSCYSFLITRHSMISSHSFSLKSS